MKSRDLLYYIHTSKYFTLCLRVDCRRPPRGDQFVLGLLFSTFDVPPFLFSPVVSRILTGRRSSTTPSAAASSSTSTVSAICAVLTWIFLLHLRALLTYPPIPIDRDSSRMSDFSNNFQCLVSGIAAGL